MAELRACSFMNLRANDRGRESRKHFSNDEVILLIKLSVKPVSQTEKSITFLQKPLRKSSEFRWHADDTKHELPEKSESLSAAWSTTNRIIPEKWQDKHHAPSYVDLHAISHARAGQEVTRFIKTYETSSWSRMTAIGKKIYQMTAVFGTSWILRKKTMNFFAHEPFQTSSTRIAATKPKTSCISILDRTVSRVCSWCIE